MQPPFLFLVGCTVKNGVSWSPLGGLLPDLQEVPSITPPSLNSQWLQLATYQCLRRVGRSLLDADQPVVPVAKGESLLLTASCHH